MLEIKKITKVYKTGDFKQEALDEVSVNFRQNEFVSILGPSGSGKTTMLNIIGGLDKYTSGDLIINGVSTKHYKAKDWDTYRNHRVGFVFQSYNLIMHQTVLSNVELALTLSGIGKKERRRRAKEVLNKVGLKNHMNKKPNQLSGGQMQRVAIARALINDPDILLADEPTGALDTETSNQIMGLLKEIAENKLVIMVTHNPDLANIYSTRIVRVLDGHIIDDSDPYDGKDEKEEKEVTKKKSKKTSMSFLTALSLSLNNLMTKKGRTILTAFAGSIGIIGIALIMSLSNGVQEYIDRVQEDTLSSYPISIEKESVDYSSMMSAMSGSKEEAKHDLDKIYSTNVMQDMMKTSTSGITKNNLVEFKKYLDNNEEIKKYTNDIKYGYSINLNIYKSDTSDGVVQVMPATVFKTIDMEQMGMMMGGEAWQELSGNNELVKSQYDVLEGALPTNYDEVVLIVDKNNEITDYALYVLGFKSQQELREKLMNAISGKGFDSEELSYNYNEIVGMKFKLMVNGNYYQKENGKWINKANDEPYMKNVLASSMDIKVVGIIRPKKDANITETTGAMAYTSGLMTHLINANNETAIVKEQLANKDIDVFTGRTFEAGNTYDFNASEIGIVDENDPSSINIYPKDFEAKDSIKSIIDKYNDDAKDKNKDNLIISYTDFVGMLMKSVTTIVDIIGYVLIAFVSISLVVSSIMIGIITYISVLERTKEIGILRAIGASKKDISRVFNAETFIVGLLAGLIGIGVTLLLNIPINMIIKAITDINNITSLPLVGAIVLILISMFLTIIAGLIPSKMASKKDPVEALRSE